MKVLLQLLNAPWKGISPFLGVIEDWSFWITFDEEPSPEGLVHATLEKLKPEAPSPKATFEVTYGESTLAKGTLLTMPRSDSVKCVKQTYKGKERLTWCNLPCGPHDFLFQDIDHATYARQNESRFLVCPECKEAILKALCG